jgi:hypothetical protein
LCRDVKQIEEKQEKGEIAAAVMEGDAQRAARLEIGDYTARIVRAGEVSARVGVMFLQTGPDEFLVVAANPPRGLKQHVHSMIYFEIVPTRERSIATSLSAFQNIKLGSFSPHWMYGITK